MMRFMYALRRKGIRLEPCANLASTSGSDMAYLQLVKSPFFTPKVKILRQALQATKKTITNMHTGPVMSDDQKSFWGV